MRSDMQTAYPPSLKLRRAWLAGRWRNIFDDEQCFSRAHQAQLAAGNLLDRGRVFAQAPRFFPQGCVFRAQPREIGGELIVLFARPHGSDQTLIADQRIDSEDADDEEKQARENFAAALTAGTRLRAGPALRAMAWLSFDYLARGHQLKVRRNVYSIFG